jgi:hypothetical protein
LKIFTAFVVIGVTILIVAIGTTGAGAAKPNPAPGAHFKSGEEPTCTGFDTATITCDGTIVGLGGLDVEILLDAEVEAAVTCTNPQNQQNASMRTTTEIASGQTTVEDASNNLVFDVSAELPSTDGSCRRNWIMTSSVEFTGEWTISVCVGNQLVLSQQSSSSAPDPSCN